MINYTIDNKTFWFIFRRCFFNIIVPILLIILALCCFIIKIDYAVRISTIIIILLILYWLIINSSVIIFSLFANTYVIQIKLKKDINNIDDSCGTFLEYQAVTIKKIYDIRCSASKYFILLNKIYFYLGISTPIFVPNDIVKKMTNIDCYDKCDNNILLDSLLHNLFIYRPFKFKSVLTTDNPKIESLLPKMIISEIDKSIYNVQSEIFGKQYELGEINI